MKKWLSAFLLAQALDAATTCAGLARGALREANPLVPDRCAGVVAVKAATSAPAVAWLPRLSRTRPRLAKGIAAGLAAGMSAAAIWNVKEYRRERADR